MIHNDIGQLKVRNLEKQGLIQFKEGPKRKFMPIFDNELEV